MDLCDKYIPCCTLLLHLLFSTARGDFWSYTPWCYFECCNENWIPKDYDKLRATLQSDLFGQHLAEGAVYGAVKGHAIYQPDKPLVLSFHGTTGTGKNHVSQLIARSWFTKGMDSKYVHVRSGTKDFPFKSKVNEYMLELQRLVDRETRNCKDTIFIFDEIDSFPPRLLNSIRAYLEYHEKVDGVDFRNTIFLFLSNTGGSALKDITEDFFKRGSRREDIRLVETERVMVKEIFNKKEMGLSHSHLIDANLISHFVPFMPLERSHVRQCIRMEMFRKKMNPSENTIEEVMDELVFHGLQDNFSVKGCKNVAEKISYVSSKHEIKNWSKEHKQRHEL